MKNNELQMPANYAVLNESETSCVKGGGVIAQVFYALGRMFSGVHYDSWESESKTLEETHGAVVSKNGNVYTYSDGFTHTMDNRSSWCVSSIGNFFYGIGDLFNALWL